MLKSPFLFILILISGAVAAQQLHTPSEIAQLLEKSSIPYAFDTSTFQPVKEVFPILEDRYNSVPLSEGIYLQPTDIIVTDKTARKYQKKANNFLAKKNYLKAIPLYLDLLELHPEHTELKMALARLYTLAHDCPQAMHWYKQVITVLPKDISAHVEMAQLCMQCQEGELAIEYITRAHLFNRNDSRLVAMMSDVYLQQGLSYHNWKLQPLYSITTMVDKTVRIQAAPGPWQAYASCKALWQYEPNYRQNMRHMSQSPVGLIEEKECLLNALISYTQLESGQAAFPELALLGRVLTERVVDDYIFYEITSRRQPELLRELSEEQLQKMIRYIRDYRVEPTEERQP
ncbi:MAG: hypothetical protein AAGG75_16100 [Bacteroidota bacterium]